MAKNQVFFQACANADHDWVSAIKQVFNFTRDQSGTLILDGYDNAQSVIHWKFDNVRNWDIDKAKLAATRGRCSYGDMRIKCLQGLICWITYMMMLGNPVVLVDFDQQEPQMGITG